MGLREGRKAWRGGLLPPTGCVPALGASWGTHMTSSRHPGRSIWQGKGGCTAQGSLPSLPYTHTPLAPACPPPAAPHPHSPRAARILIPGLISNANVVAYASAVPPSHPAPRAPTPHSPTPTHSPTGTTQPPTPTRKVHHEAGVGRQRRREVDARRGAGLRGVAAEADGQGRGVGVDARIVNIQVDVGVHPIRVFLLGGVVVRWPGGEEGAAGQQGRSRGGACAVACSHSSWGKAGAADRTGRGLGDGASMLGRRGAGCCGCRQARS